MEALKQIAVIAAFSVGLIFSVITIGSAAFAQQENATSSSPPSTTGQITKGDIMKGEIKGGNVATLSGQEEVPPTNSQATGMAEFTVTGENAEYSVNASNIQGVTAGHIHSGGQRENGPIVVTLFKNDSPTNEVSETGSITADKLEGPMAGKQLTDLVNAMSNGETYVNIHTEQNPNGEIRGQITSSQ
jgi:hypothetical protein